ncbi:MAG: PD-(D/E)XK nuclease family protein [Dysgonomonas sp.]
MPFTGEPLSGLQIMGMLETRALDFENLIILSMNEGVFPQRKAANSFIPYNLRKGFGLPTYEHQDSIFSYHFYRLINRAKRIYLLHDSRSEGLQSGEVSRYFSQMKYLYADYFNIQEKIATYEISVTENTPITIRKNEHVQNLLHKFLTGEKNLSASAINMYIDCPLQFYFSIIEELDESDDISETIEANTFGSIFHSIMEWIYRPLHGKLVTADLLHNIRKNDNLLTKEIERSFAKNYFKTDPEKARKLTGQNYLTGEVIRKYVKKVLQTDAKSTPFIYVESERRIKTNYPLPSGLSVSLKGFIDRIDEVRGKTRIVDYKTGKGELIFKDMEQLFDKEAKDRPKAIMQVFMYAYLYLLDNPDKIIEPGIYYLRNLFSKNFMPKISCKNLPNIENFSEYQAEFKVHFDACLEEIFDTETPFSQTTTGKACEWCLFTNICNK